MIDLHVHTNMSDGTLSPVEVVYRAAEKGLGAIAITDHDTVAAIAEAKDAGQEVGVEVISGVEISAKSERGILHILGYFIAIDDSELLESLDYLKKGRQERIPRIVSKLQSRQVGISVAEVDKEAIGGVPGRPHVANVMVRRGHVRTIQEAFDRYLKKGAVAYVEKTKLPLIQSLQAITNAGGVPVLAHPYSLEEEDPHRLEEIIRYMVLHGLKGIEAYYPRHTPEQTKLFLDLAAKLDLAITGGTDFHGSNKPEVELGVLPNGISLPYSLVEKLRARRQDTSLRRLKKK